MACSAPDCRRVSDVLNFPALEDQPRRLCARHRSDEQHQAVADLAERGRRVGITGGEHWPYGPNIDVESRRRLVDWAETAGYRLATPRRNCLHWVIGKVRRCSALREYDHAGQLGGCSALDHLTFWTRDGAPALILGQPYHPPEPKWIEQVTAEWPVDIEVTDEAPWYGYGTYGVLVTPRAGSLTPRAPAARPAADVTWTAVADLLARHGGRALRVGDRARRAWAIPEPGHGYVSVTVTLRPRWCTIAVDRWTTDLERPDGAPEWLREHAWPVVRQALTRRRVGAAFLPSGRTWACADPVERPDLLPLLDLWLTQEAVWTAEAAARVGCGR